MGRPFPAVEFYTEDHPDTQPGVYRRHECWVDVQAIRKNYFLPPDRITIMDDNGETSVKAMRKLEMNKANQWLGMHVYVDTNNFNRIMHSLGYHTYVRDDWSIER